MSEETQKDPNTFAVKNVRMSYPRLTEALKETNKNGKDHWSVALIIDQRKGAPAKENLKAVTDAIARVRKESFGGKKVTAFLHDGGDEKKEDVEGYGKGTFYFTARKYIEQPRMIDHTKQPVKGDKDISRIFYPGARVSAIISVYAQKGGEFADKVACRLECLQFVNHDGKLTSFTPVEVDDYLDAVEVTDAPEDESGEAPDDDDDDDSAPDASGKEDFSFDA